MAKGIFCLEDNWWKDPTRPCSVEPVLELLRNWSPSHVPYAHRNVESHGGLFEYLAKWKLKKYNSFPILHLAFHGNAQCLIIGDRRVPDNVVTFEELEDALAGACDKRIIHFSGCNVLEVHGKRINSFLKRTGALAVSGYTETVDWLDSTAFEPLVFASMQQNAFTRAGAKAMAVNIRIRSGGLAKRLGFKMVIRPK